MPFLVKTNEGSEKNDKRPEGAKEILRGLPQAPQVVCGKALKRIAAILFWGFRMAFVPLLHSATLEVFVLRRYFFYPLSTTMPTHYLRDHFCRWHKKAPYPSVEEISKIMVIKLLLNKN